MKILHVLTKLDELVTPEAHWISDAYTPLSCSLCKDLLSQHVHQGINIQLKNEKLKGPIGAVRGLVRIDVYREDFREALSGLWDGFHFGKVLIEGVLSPNYRSVIVEDRVRTPRQGDSRTTRSSCTQCGRPNQQNTFGASWFRTSDVRGRHTFTSVSGTGLYLSEHAVGMLPASLVDELRLFPHEVRKG